MIIEKNTGILDKIEPYSVILIPSNTKGWLSSGLMTTVSKKWPLAFERYHNYCKTFTNGHEEEILGTFVPCQIGKDLIICHMIIQNNIGKNMNMVDYEALSRICAKIDRQTLNINSRFHLNWSIHVPANICGNT